jgi:transcription elongation GreA/GreB family factor
VGKEKSFSAPPAGPHVERHSSALSVLTRTLDGGDIVPLQTHTHHTVSLGSHVHVRDIESGEREVYTLTRPSDADIQRNRISTLSPIGRALYGQRPGDIVEVHAPGGIFLVEIEMIEQADGPLYARDG